MSVLKAKYAAAYEALVITLAGLAASSTWLVGRQSTAINNSSNLYTHAMLSGKITTGTAPTAGFIEVWGYAQHDDAPTYPDVITGSDAAATFADAFSKQCALVRIDVIQTDTTANQTYFIKARDLAPYFGGVMPKRYGVFVTHSTVAALNATGSNHEILILGYNEEST